MWPKNILWVLSIQQDIQDMDMAHALDPILYYKQESIL